MKRRICNISATLLTVLTILPAFAFGEKSRIEFARDDAKGQMRVLIDGREAIVYQYGKDLDMAHFYPVRSPGGRSMTVQHPTPYPHHRSFWFADKVRLEGERTVEFYASLYSGPNGHKDPKPPFKDHIRHVRFIEGPATRDSADITMTLVWEMDGTKPVLDELRRMHVAALGNGEYVLDLTFTLTASYGDVAFVSDAVHYAWPYVRMNSEFSVEGGGRITNSEGGIDQEETNNRVARWVDYSNRVGDEAAGLAIFLHPDHAGPNRWLTRDYGTFGPRRVDARSGKPFTVHKNETISQRVGILVHRGDVSDGTVAQRYRQYIAPKGR